MRFLRPRRLAVAPFAIVALGVGGCGPPTSPAPETASIAHFDLQVHEALAYFEERTLTCIGPAAPFPDVRQWDCAHESQDRTRLAVRVSGDAVGVTQLVGIATGLDPEASSSFLVSTVAKLAAPAADIDLDLWSLERAETGGVVLTSGAMIELRRPSRIRAVVVTPAPPE